MTFKNWQRILMKDEAAISEPIRNAVLIGIDLGPNLSVTESFATLLWLMALWREGMLTRVYDFFKLGYVAMPIALLLSLFAS